VISSPARCRSRCMPDAASSSRNTSISLSSHVRLGTRQVFHPPDEPRMAGSWAISRQSQAAGPACTQDGDADPGHPGRHRGSPQGTPVRRDLPTYRELIYPTLRAVASLGGSAQGAEITDALTELLEVTPEQLAITYDGRPKSVLIDRMDWARSYAKLAGALDSPRRGLFILSNLGKHILSLPEEEGRAQVAQLDRDVRAARRRRGSATYSGELVESDEGETGIDRADRAGAGNSSVTLLAGLAGSGRRVIRSERAIGWPPSPPSTGPYGPSPAP
jgi:hypothetical protein